VGSDQNHLKGKEMQKVKWLSEKPYKELSKEEKREAKKKGIDIPY